MWKELYGKKMFGRLRLSYFEYVHPAHRPSLQSYHQAVQLSPQAGEGLSYYSEKNRWYAEPISTPPRAITYNTLVGSTK